MMLIESLPLLGIAMVVWLSLAGLAFANSASAGQPLFYPCTSCHPVTLGADGKPTKALPNGFTKHEIVLQSHDKLAEGDKACLVCHDDPARDPGKLKVLGGGFVDVTGDVSKVCYGCHSAKYKEWQQGIHGRHEKSCTAAGCHDPHTPAYIYGGPVRPFAGTGFQSRAVSARVPFTAMATYPVPPATLTPPWLSLAAAMGAALSLGLVGTLVLWRSKR
jgi:hypothetical protein